MGDHNDLPMCPKYLQPRRLHEQDQPLEQMDAMIEEIRRLMLRSAETASEERLGRREATAKTTQQQQQQQQDGADEQLQRMIWDPGGFQHRIWEAHEQELMNFVAEEYDAGASSHVSHLATSANSNHVLKRGATSFEI
jgi:hypothetical protein